MGSFPAHVNDTFSAVAHPRIHAAAWIDFPAVGGVKPCVCVHVWERGEEVGKSGGFIEKRLLGKRALDQGGDWFKAACFLAVRLYTGPPSLLLTLHLSPPEPQLPPALHAFFSACRAKELSKEEGRAAGYHIYVRDRGTKQRWQISHTWICSVKPDCAETNCFKFPARYIREDTRLADWQAITAETEISFIGFGLCCCASFQKDLLRVVLLLFLLKAPH